MDPANDNNYCTQATCPRCYRRWMYRGTLPALEDPKWGDGSYAKTCPECMKEMKEFR